MCPKIIILCFFILGVSNVLAENGCSLTMPTDLPENEPVILYAESSSASYSLFRPNGVNNVLPEGSRLKLVCAGNKNAIEALGQSSVELDCEANGKFVNTRTGEEHALNELGCKAIPTSDLLVSDEPCLKGKGTILKAGFDIDGNFETTFEMCFDAESLTTYYAHNTINGATINHNVKQAVRRAFRANGMGLTSAAVNKLYVQKNQVKVFEKYFGKSQSFINTNSFLARGHMAPDADFIFSYEQLSTYFYANVAPEFQVVNAGNWLRIESLARSIAGDLGDDVESYTGAMGILRLQGVPIYLDTDERMPAVEHYFKVLKHEASDSAIVFISLNNPFASEATELCENVCKRAGFDDTRFEDYSKGYTYCCELRTFKKVYADLPADLTASELLTSAQVLNLKNLKIA